MKLKTQELEMPWGLGILKGRLLVATPTRSKPRNVSADDWCSRILATAEVDRKFHLVIPCSFWPDGKPCHGEPTSTFTEFRRFDVMDAFCGAEEYRPDTPFDSIREIIDCLMKGDDVLVLSATKKIPGFLPAVLSRILEPDVHIVKLWWPIICGSGYELSLFQLGYLYGLTDALLYAELDVIRKHVLAGDEGQYGKAYEPTGLPDNIEFLEKQSYLTCSNLESIGRELFEEITPELIGLVEFLSECESHPAVDVTVGSFASIGYRLCDVFKATATLGTEALNAIKNSQQKQVASSCSALLLSEQLATYQAHLGNIADQLDYLYSSSLCFLSCDLDVLRGYPEVAEISGLSDTVKLIGDQLMKIQDRMDEIGAAARHLSQIEDIDEVPRVNRKIDRDWKAMRAMLEQCLQISREKLRSDEPRWNDQPITHPKAGEKGKVITIKHPTKPSSPVTWKDAGKMAVFVPGGKVPGSLNGLGFSIWDDHPTTSKGWNALDLLMPTLKEPPFPKSSLPMASGVVIIEADGRLWMVSPSNMFGGYETTFPKGKLDDAELSLQANALKEGFEESGLKVRITGYLGDYKRTTSMTRLYLAERVGGSPCDVGWESQAVRLVAPSEWPRMLTNPSDLPVLVDLQQRFGQTGMK